MDITFSGETVLLGSFIGGSTVVIPSVQDLFGGKFRLVAMTVYSVPSRATSFAERLRLSIAVIHGETKESEEDGRNSPPPQGAELVYNSFMSEPEYFTANLLSVVPKEKPPLNVVGDVHGKISIIVVSFYYYYSGTFDKGLPENKKRTASLERILFLPNILPKQNH